MHRVVVARQLDEGEVEAVQRLLDLAAAADGSRPLAEQSWLDLVHGGRDGVTAIIAYGAGDEAGDDDPVGYAQLARAATGWSLEYVVDPRRRGPGNALAIGLVGEAVGIVGREGGGHLQLWVSKPRPEHDEVAGATGLTPVRDLYQMRRPLPVGEPWALEVRPFRPGLDDEAWLSTNNRAFAWHPDQGGWDLAMLKAREAEPWFDPAGFLLHEERGRLAGFCWTKVHADERPPVGEIYVIAVDPDWQGTGLGRRLVLAGLDHLAGRGLTVGMLYVEASNRPALKLYLDLGFEVDHIDRAYAGEVPPAPAPTPGGDGELP
jgi:mycothiol synthase